MSRKPSYASIRRCLIAEVALRKRHSQRQLWHSLKILRFSVAYAKQVDIALMELREPTKGEITRLAYALYLLRGCEPGRDVEDWVKAEEELREKPIGQPQTTRAAHAAASHPRPVWFDKSSHR